MRKREKVFIALCDHNHNVHDEVLRFLKAYEEEKNVRCILTHIYATSELLSLRKPFDILLLEIDMPETDGIEAAFRLKDKGMDCKIILLTGRVDRFKEAFKIGAIRFVTKPVEKEELFEAIDAARMHVEGRGMVEVFLDGRPYRIMQREITYIMANGSETKVFTRNYSYRSENTLVGWKEQLDESLFSLCHRSYLVNLSQIAYIEKAAAVLKTGEKVPVARRKEKELLQRHMERDRE